MIKLNIDSKMYELSDDLRNRIIEQLGGLDEFMDTLQEGDVSVSWEGGSHEQTRVSAELRGGGRRFEASDTDWKPITAIDRTRHKLEAQITKEHSKDLDRRDHPHI